MHHSRRDASCPRASDIPTTPAARPGRWRVRFAARRLPLLSLLLLTTTLSLSGCKGTQDEGTVIAGETTPEDEDRGYILQNDGQSGDLGAACDIDPGCKVPLRCLQGTCVAPPAVDGTQSDDTPRVLLDVRRDRPVRVYLEVADDDFERQRGLMFRTRMAEDWGMLFVFEDDRERSFWMQNTYLPLDMIFITRDGEITNVAEHAKPLDTGPRYRSTAPAHYVLEVNAGFASAHEITAGQRVRLVDVPGDHEPMILQ